jgi:hypothetical protein
MEDLPNLTMTGDILGSPAALRRDPFPSHVIRTLFSKIRAPKSLILCLLLPDSSAIPVELAILLPRQAPTERLSQAARQRTRGEGMPSPWSCWS